MVTPSRASRTAFLTAIALVGFAANSILCRLALGPRLVDAASFTAVRLASGAAVLWLLIWRRGGARTGGSWASAAALFAYAAAFSFAYLRLGAGVSWAIYSLRGRGATDPLGATADNFARSLPLAATIVVATLPQLHLSGRGLACAMLSGALASGIGYSIWQLVVPVLATLGGTLILQEPLHARTLLAGMAVLGGVALSIVGRWQPA